MKKNLFLTVIFLISLSVSIFAGDEIVWKNLTQAEIDIKAPQVEADADAEALVWEVSLDDKKAGKLKYSHYVRLKIFTERGREKYSKVDIPYSKISKIEDLAARVIKADGSIVYVQPSEIFDREIVRAKKVKVNAKSFAVPGIAPGVIVEYQYSEVIKGDSVSGERLYFDRDIPVHKLTYRLRGYDNSNLYFKSFNSEIMFSKKEDGFYEASYINSPAYKDEPFSPPDAEIRKWVFVSYGFFGDPWYGLHLRYSRFLTEFTKSDKEFTALARQIVQGSQTDEEKVHKIFDYVRANTRNLSYEPNVNLDDLDLPKLKNAKDVLKAKNTSSMGVDMTFASMIRAAGLESALVLSGNRNQSFFSPKIYPYASFVHYAGVAVKIGNDWKFFDPGVPYLPFNSISGSSEDTFAMLIGDSGYVWKPTPITTEDKSRVIRRSKGVLDANGTLTATLTYEFSGQLAIRRRQENWNKTVAKQQENIESEIRDKAKSAEISDAALTNLNNPDLPLIFTMKVKIPNYASVTGKRMFVPGNVFEYGSEPVFASSSRKHDIYFPTPWSENDFCDIQLPEGFEPDSVEAPVPISESRGIARDFVRYEYLKGTRTLAYNRNFFFGKDYRALFPAKAYPALKGLFDGFHRMDTHAVSILKVGAK